MRNFKWITGVLPQRATQWFVIKTSNYADELQVHIKLIIIAYINISHCKIPTTNESRDN